MPFLISSHAGSDLSWSSFRCISFFFHDFMSLGTGSQLMEKKSFALSISSISFAVKLVELPPYHSRGCSTISQFLVLYGNIELSSLMRSPYEVNDMEIQSRFEETGDSFFLAEDLLILRNNSSWNMGKHVFICLIIVR